MMSRTEHLFAQALELSEADRADLAARLIASLDPTTDSGVAEAWKEEVGRRITGLDSGQVEGVPWLEVRRMLSGQPDDSSSR